MVALNGELEQRMIFQEIAKDLHRNFSNEQRTTKMLQRDLERAKEILIAMKEGLDTKTRQLMESRDLIEAQSGDNRTMKRALEEIGNEFERMKERVKNSKEEVLNTREECERRIRDVTSERARSEDVLEVHRLREYVQSEQRRREVAERALDDCASAFALERRDQDQEMKRHIERRLELENQCEKMEQLCDEVQRKTEKELKEKQRELQNAIKQNDALKLENEQKRAIVKTLEDDCKIANTALRERSADMAMAVKKLNVELKQQRMETERGMAKRVDALRVAFGNAIEEVKDVSRRALDAKNEEINEMKQKNEETKARFQFVEKHTLKARDSIIDLANEKEELEEERDELRRALQRAGELNAKLTKRAMDMNISTTINADASSTSTTKKTSYSSLKKPKDSMKSSGKALAETLKAELNLLKIAHDNVINSFATGEKDLEKMVTRMDEISREIMDKSEQVRLANASAFGN